MVRCFKPKRAKTYASCQLQSAIDAVNERKMSVREAAKEFQVPKSTICDHVIEKHIRKCGHQTAFSYKEEKRIAKCLIFSSQYGWPCDRRDLAAMVNNYALLTKKKVPWDTGKGPGIDFIRGYEKRWEHLLSRRKVETLTVARAKSLNADCIQQFFSMMENIYTQHSFSEYPSRIYNLDETGLNTNQSSSSCFFRRGTKTTYVLQPTCGKTTFTVLFCVNANGSDLLPPFVCYKGKHLHSTWCVGGPPKTNYGASPSGWMETEVFYSWLKNVSSFYLHSLIV
jgi:hypothetical protein